MGRSGGFPESLLQRARGPAHEAVLSMNPMRWVYGAAQRYFRPRRMRTFAQAFRPTPETRILDLGGTLFNWTLLPVRPRLTIVNVLPRPTDLPHDVEWIHGDALALQDIGEPFDIVYSNSVIEHLGTWENQLRFAEQVRRLGRSYFVQTPNRWFFMEPHLAAPFIHFLPKSWQRPLMRFTPWGIFGRATQADVDACLAEIRLLSAGDMRGLFPEAELVRERFAGMTKSLISMVPPKPVAPRLDERPVAQARA